jgi:molybdate transport system substrate-binding protein
LKSFLQMCLAFLLVVFLGAAGGCGVGETDTTALPRADQEIQQGSKQEELLVYCGAGLRKPMEEIAVMFQEETGILVQFSFGGSAQCIGKILTVDKGDAFLPGDVAELKELIEREMIDRQKEVVFHVPVLAVPQGNPAGITGIEDLGAPGVKVVLGDPEANPIGKLADKVLKEYGIFDKVEPNVVARTATVNELFTYLALKQADAAIIWEDNLLGSEDVELIETAVFADYIKTVPVVSLKCSANPEMANRFVEFTAGKKAMAVWEKWGFKPVPKVE